VLEASRVASRVGARPTVSPAGAEGAGAVVAVSPASPASPAAAEGVPAAAPLVPVPTADWSCELLIEQPSIHDMELERYI
jgi:hypothetical protein